MGVHVYKARRYDFTPGVHNFIGGCVTQRTQTFDQAIFDPDVGKPGFGAGAIKNLAVLIRVSKVVIGLLVMICVALNVAVNDLEIQLWGLDWHPSQSGEAAL
jgi:hypothetical protein